MDNSKFINAPLVSHFKLSSKQCPTSEKDKEEIQKIPYASVVGSFMYVMVCTGPTIAHAISVVNHFLSDLGKEHWQVVKWIHRYLRGTSKVCLCFGSGEPTLNGYKDADMASDVDSKKYTSRYMMTFAKKVVSWQSRL
uniref:Retrovirus-related Pol polyprotein from transposon TNT 1-94 n=1 Tax=Cajanus cajan TaxID=3821 RepID=A0A151RUP5_CAJCA|nr:Retrovirus-related Pol polyprotein from transposon TNT 1-94 [Cajanus cajan]